MRAKTTRTADIETSSEKESAKDKSVWDPLYSDINRVLTQMSNEKCAVITSSEKIKHFLTSVPHLSDMSHVNHINHPNSGLESLQHEKASPDSGIQSQGESPHRHQSISDTEFMAVSASTSSQPNSQQKSRSVNTRKKNKETKRRKRRVTPTLRRRPALPTLRPTRTVHSCKPMIPRVIKVNWIRR